MNDLRALHDAFGELERRADAAPVGTALAPPARHRMARLVPVAATVVVVAGLAAGAVWLVPGDNAGEQAASPPTSTSTTASSPPTSASGAPKTPEELIDRFTAVLGGTATFTVTEKGPGAGVVTAPAGPDNNGPDKAGEITADDSPVTEVGASIVGTLTAGGVTGGFDLLTYPASPSDKPSCEGLSPNDCTVSTLPDGTVVRVDRYDGLEGGGTTFHANVLHTDGNMFDMHVSNQRSPKGASDKLGAQPPLTTDQMVAILTSDRW
jgi:hypothetical protein